jgi:hypothetical protein
MPLAADESRLVPDVAAEKMFELAEDDNKFWSFMAEDCADASSPPARSWKRVELFARLRPSVESSSLVRDIDDIVRWNLRRLDGTGSKENLATGSAIRASGLVS